MPSEIVSGPQMNIVWCMLIRSVSVRGDDDVEPQSASLPVLTMLHWMVMFLGPDEMSIPPSPQL